MKLSVKGFIHRLLDGAYYIGIIENFSLQGGKINWISYKGYTEGWFADPFIVDADDNTITLIVEEYRYNRCKGHLSQIVVNRNDYSIKNITPILQQDTHLSFPYIIRENGQLYICPESGERNEAAIYELNKECTLANRIIDGPMLDTQITKIGDFYYAFTVRAAGNGLLDTKKLLIYRSSTLNGPYYFIQDIDNKKCTERGAGTIFEYDGRLVRPAQNCEGGYGKGVIFYELKLRQNKIEETEIGRIDANSKDKYGLCFHTFSVFKNLAAVDGFDYINRPLGYIAPYIYKVKSLIGKIFH